MSQSAPESNGPVQDTEAAASMPADTPVGWLGELAGLPVPAEDAELLADALQRVGQQMTPLVTQLEPGACITGDFDPRWP